MNTLPLFLPCAAGVEPWLADEVQRITGTAPETLRGGVRLQADWNGMLRLNLHSRLTQRVLVQLEHRPYRDENDIYEAAAAVPWEEWFTPRETFKIELTAHQSPLKSLNFAALKIKDAVADRFRERGGVRPDVDTQWPAVRVFAHLSADQVTLYVDTSGEPLFKRGWREDKGEAPLKETLAAAMIAASGWDAATPLYDPCCGSGTIAIEAAQIACNIAPGLARRFGFERLRGYSAAEWGELKGQAQAARRAPTAPVFGSDVAFRMVDFAQRNAERAGVGEAVQFRGGDALQRMPPGDTAGVMLLNPPYGERIEAAGVAGRGRGGREQAQMENAGDFFTQLASHWKKNYAGWTAWVLSPDAKLPGRMRLKESRRIPMWNGPIECRLFRFDMVAGSARNPAMQLVIDTNVVLDLLVFGDPGARPLLEGLEAGSLRWLATAAMREELARVLAYPKLAPRVAFHRGSAASVLEDFDRHARLVEVPPKAEVTCGDPDDQKFIDLAIAHRCLLLSKDDEVLRMRKRLARLQVTAAPMLPA